MALDIKEKVEELVAKLKGDPKLLANFKSEPIKTVEKLIGIDLPDEQIGKVVDMVKAKLDLDKVSGMLGGLFGKK